MSGRTLEQVLRSHAQRNGGPCSCGRHDFGAPGWHYAHVAAEVRAWLGEVLAGEGLLETVAFALGDMPESSNVFDCTGEATTFINAPVDLVATAALTAVREHLGVPEEGRQERATGAQAGAEVETGRGDIGDAGRLPGAGNEGMA